MTKHMPKLVTKNGEHFYGENFIHDFPKSWKHIKEVDWGDKLKLNYTTYGYMLMEIDWGGKFNYTSCGYPMANWQGHETHPTGHKTSEVDWGGHDPNGSDNPPPMSIINLDDLLGRTFLLNGERKRATISEHTKDLCQQEVPRDYAHALQLDIHNGNNKWKEAIDLEIEQIKEYQVFTDVGNAYLQALTREKLYIVGGPEFEELQGHVLVMYKALYGTRSGGACWHDKFFDILHHMGFKTSEADWGRHDPNCNHVNESLLSEVDWGAHNPDADDPEQLTGELFQSFLTFVVQLQWLVALWRLYLHKSLPCPSLW